MLGHVPFSFAAPTLRRSVGGGGGDGFSLLVVTGGAFSVVTGGVSPPREFLKVPLTYFQIVVGKGESDKGDLMGRIEAQTAQYGPTALVLRD